jgi:hypothetical protein
LALKIILLKKVLSEEIRSKSWTKDPNSLSGFIIVCSFMQFEIKTRNQASSASLLVLTKMMLGEVLIQPVHRNVSFFLGIYSSKYTLLKNVDFF